MTDTAVDLRDGRTLGFDQADIDGIKARFVALETAAGGTRQPCHSRTCLMVATTRVFWPGTLPGEDYPLYCEGCAAWARTVMETLGHKYHAEDLPAPPDGTRRRAISVSGSL